MSVPSRLPVELWLQIFEHVEPSDLWLSVRRVNRTFRMCAEDIAKAHIIHRISLSMNLSLGSGTHHRWYDVRGSVRLAFKAISQQNPQYAEFEITAFLPVGFSQSAEEKWNRMCAKDTGGDTPWNVKLDGGSPIAMLLPDSTISREQGLCCNWKSMLSGYLARLRSS
ncbi:uncharacterized protein K489DRAFT_378525 [Dissoconium aciculare CBS 342.82]|uniref:F-box domain-containing protein n=1 Tax=Dissoconium aciculare CBS 342.82 TaxID=1314786 RepID=A0A6J3MBB9_9PEZI|nr:uncharacterized protein K489DRAFT_378525 [Dissoconium aciculare CBS 342.82]KAF1824122.1 hypothetical protein K489DRAFT_378525 [Dissoconium aciculare CBS 342.82]